MPLNRREFMLLMGAIGFATTRAGAGEQSLAVITHPGVGASRLSDVDLEAVFLTERRYWSGSKAIIPFNLAPRTDERLLFDQVVLRMDPDAIARYWLDRRVRGGTRPPRQAPDPMTVSRLVAKLEGAIGYVPEPMATHDVKVVARIRNGKVQAP